MPKNTDLTFLTRSALGLVVGVATLGLGSGVAAAESPPAQPGFEIVQPGNDPEPIPVPVDDLVATPVDPDPDPVPEGADDLAVPTPQPDPDPQPDDTLATPQGDDDPSPIDGPDDLTGGDGCNATHGCEPDCPEPLATCDLTDGDPGDDTPEDAPEDTPSDDTPEVEDESAASGRLPQTGGGIALLGGIGASLTGLGLAIRRWATR